jgi:ketosteroid isomerase-like protein
MLTGHAPFEGQNTSTVLLKHLQEPPPPPRRFCPDIHPQLEQVILQALAKNPQQRFSSASEFARHLTAAISAREHDLAHDVADPGELEDRTMTAPRLAVPRFAVPAAPAAIAVAPPSPWREPTPGETKAPTLLIERRSRAKLYAVVALLAAAAVCAFAYLLNVDWQAQADEGPAANVVTESTPAASSSPDSVQKAGQKFGPQVEPTSGQANLPSVEAQPKPAGRTEPAAYVKPANAAAANEKMQREVRAAYSEWAMAAVRGDWQKHANFYADKVEYFRDGTMTRASVISRKRAIFGKLDSYWLRFSESPQIVLKKNGGQPEADVTFDRSWTLRRGRKQTSGRAQGMITLRREGRGWRIVGEKQIKNK